MVYLEKQWVSRQLSHFELRYILDLAGKLKKTANTYALSCLVKSRISGKIILHWLLSLKIIEIKQDSKGNKRWSTTRREIS